MIAPHQVQLLVLAKEPVPGRVKTRLSPALTPDQAAEVARASLCDTLTAIACTPVARRVLVLDGDPKAFIRQDFDVLAQTDGDLGRRLASAFDEAWDTCALPMLLIGMDTPQVTAELLSRAAQQLLDSADGVLGLAEDGGWWALGLHAPLPGAFEGVPMSVDVTGSSQRQRLAELGLRPSVLPVLKDIDHVEDVALVAAQTSSTSALSGIARTLGLVTA